MSERFILEKHGHVMWLKFNRPKRLNAMTIERWGEFDERLAAIDADRDVRCLVLAGEGRAFLAGHDVGEIREHNEDIESGKLTPAQLREWQKNLQHSTRRIRQARFPVIACVHGYAVGAGCEVVFACDLVVAAESTRFGFPEVNIGVTITNGGTYFMPRKIGLAKARELAYTGEFIDAVEAHRIGLVNRVVPDGTAREAAARPGPADREPGAGRSAAPQGDDRLRAGRVAGGRAQLRDRGARADRDDPRQPGRSPRVLREARAEVHR